MEMLLSCFPSKKHSNDITFNIHINEVLFSKKYIIKSQSFILATLEQIDLALNI